MSDQLAQQSAALTGRSGKVRIGSNETEKSLVNQPPSVIVETTPHQDVNTILLNQRAIQELKKSMVDGIHYGPPYKNSKKETLLKPGAEWTQKLFGIRPQFEVLDRVIEPNFEDLSKSWILFRYRCNMIEIATGTTIGEAIGSCNSLEDKYHWRKGQRTCVDPNCDGAVYRSKWPESTPEDQRGWYCRECKTKYEANDTRITDQHVGKTTNTNPMDLLNTLDKIAQKRAYVSAVLNATAASSIFAPGDDMDEMGIIEIPFTETAIESHSTPEAKPSESEPNESDVQYNEQEVINQTAFMYNHHKHAFNSVKAMIDTEEIEATDTTRAAVWKVFMQRAASKPYQFSEPKVLEALTAFREAEGSKVPVAKVSQFVADGGTVEQAWQAVKAYKALEDTPPAQAAKAKKEETGNEVPF